MRVIRDKTRRFSRGDIVKQDNNRGGFDFFHVEHAHVHENGSQGLDVIGDKDGVRYGLASDFSLPATLRELIEAREKGRS